MQLAPETPGDEPCGRRRVGSLSWSHGRSKTRFAGGLVTVCSPTEERWQAELHVSRAPGSEGPACCPAACLLYSQGQA